MSFHSKARRKCDDLSDEQIAQIRSNNRFFISGVAVGAVTGVALTLGCLMSKKPLLLTLTPDQVQGMLEDPNHWVEAKKLAIGHFGACIVTE